MFVVQAIKNFVNLVHAETNARTVTQGRIFFAPNTISLHDYQLINFMHPLILRIQNSHANFPKGPYVIVTQPHLEIGFSTVNFFNIPCMGSSMVV